MTGALYDRYKAINAGFVELESQAYVGACHVYCRFRSCHDGVDASLEVCFQVCDRRGVFARGYSAIRTDNVAGVAPLICGHAKYQKYRGYLSLVGPTVYPDEAAD